MIETLDNGVKFESFEVAERPESPEQDECRAALINKLGLQGQKALVSSGTTTACPFREITKEEVNVYMLLCPHKTSLTEYRHDPIPLRVLEIADRAMSLGMFQNVEVWHPEMVRDDPVLIGHTMADRYARGNRVFILARWGAHLDEWPALVRKARESLTAKAQTAITDAKALVERIAVCEPDKFPTCVSFSAF